MKTTFFVVSDQKEQSHYMQVLEQLCRTKWIHYASITLEQSKDLTIDEIKGNIFFIRRCSDWRDYQNRQQVYQHLKEGTILNRASLDQPLLKEKYYQQLVLWTIPGIPTIPSFCYGSRQQVLKAITSWTISFPFVIKPTIGTQWKGIYYRTCLNTLEKRRDKNIRGIWCIQVA
jgi:hypothetical protein